MTKRIMFYKENKLQKYFLKKNPQEHTCFFIIKRKGYVLPQHQNNKKAHIFRNILNTRFQTFYMILMSFLSIPAFQYHATHLYREDVPVVGRWDKQQFPFVPYTLPEDDF